MLGELHAGGEAAQKQCIRAALRDFEDAARRGSAKQSPESRAVDVEEVPDVNFTE